MKTIKSKTAFFMAIAMATSVSSGTFASAKTVTTSVQNISAPIGVTAPIVTRSTLEGLATVLELNGDKQLTVKIEEQTIALNIGQQTLFINGKTGIPSSLEGLKAGDRLYVYYSAAMTRSLPPQSSAVAIVTGVEENQTIPRLMTVKEITESKENQIRFLNTDEDMIVTILKENPISPFKTKQVVTIKDIQPGSKVFVWYDIVAMSYPGQTAAKKTVLVSQAETAAQIPVKVSANGALVDLGKNKIIEKNGKVMVPLRAVSKALGFKLEWHAKTRTANIDDGAVKTAVTVGQDAYYKASSKAIGLTASFAYGVSPEIINGSLYVPVDLFTLLYSNDQAVKVSGDTLVIANTNK